MSDSQYRPRRRSRRDTNHRTPGLQAPGLPPASPSNAPPLPQISADQQQTFDDYGKAADLGPGAVRRAMGRAMAKLNVAQMKNLAMLEQLQANFLTQPGMDFHGLQKVLPVMDRVHMTSKLVKAFAQVVFDTSKPQTNDPAPKDPLLSLANQKLAQQKREKEGERMASVREMAQQIMREGEAKRNSNSSLPSVKSPAASPGAAPSTSPSTSAPASAPMTLPITGAREDSRK